MKKFNFIWLVSMLMLMPICFVSCSDDDDEIGVDPTGSDLVGTWEVVSEYNYYKENGRVEYDDTDTEYGEGEGFILKITFKKDGTFLAYNAEYDDESNEWEEDSFNGTWSYQNGKLQETGFWEDDTTTWTVKELTRTKLVIEIAEGEDGYIPVEDYYKNHFEDYDDVNYERYELRKISD